ARHISGWPPPGSGRSVWTHTSSGCARPARCWTAKEIALMSTPHTLATRRHMEPPIRHEWLAQWDEVILEPDLPIVDPHHHLWDLPDWDSRYLLDDLLADLRSGHNILATVYLQCWSMYRADGP